MEFNLCFYGLMPDDVNEWIKYWNFKTEIVGNYTNIIIPNDINYDCIFDKIDFKFKYFDGFSPNLNKHLHIGHLSNFIFAKALQKLDISEKTIAIFGDTLDGNVKKEDASQKIKEYLTKFDYHIDDTYFASEQILLDGILLDGEGEFLGCKVFNLLDDTKIVGIKSSGETTYFYQDYTLQNKLKSPTLYLTGDEQCNHFGQLKKLFPNITHKGLGLVLIDGKKMSSSTGDVIFMEDFLCEMNNQFKGDEYLAWNVIAGDILKSSIEGIKNVNKSKLMNIKSSYGLYISYTMARMFSAGIEKSDNKDFHSKKLKYLLIKAKLLLQPNILFSGLVDLCKEINYLYETNIIKNNLENKKMFTILTDDLILASKKLGLFLVEKV